MPNNLQRFRSRSSPRSYYRGSRITKDRGYYGSYTTGYEGIPNA